MKINTINENGLKKGGKVVKENIGKGRILLTIDKLSVAAAACFEFLRELPGFEYLKSIGVGNLTTKFNTWISSITTTTLVAKLVGIIKSKLNKESPSKAR